MGSWCHSPNRSIPPVCGAATNRPLQDVCKIIRAIPISRDDPDALYCFSCVFGELPAPAEQSERPITPARYGRLMPFINHHLGFAPKNTGRHRKASAGKQMKFDSLEIRLASETLRSNLASQTAGGQSPALCSAAIQDISLVGSIQGAQGVVAHHKDILHGGAIFQH